MAQKAVRPRRFLFLHQNFPGQFVHVASALAAQGHEVVALGLTGCGLPGLRYVSYAVEPPAQPSALRLVRDFELKVVRGWGAVQQMQQLQLQGFEPDVVVVHPGWGEGMFVREVWPRTRLLVFHEFYYSAHGADVNFDPEFPMEDLRGLCRLRLKNTHLLQAIQLADGVYTPTHWQGRQLPEPWRAQARVIFDGIRTDRACPDPQASLTLARQQHTLSASDEVLTFVNRNLEPCRGFHVFMRALPEILRRRPKARVLILGGDEISYGAAPAQGGTWRQVMLQALQGQLDLTRIHFVGRQPYAAYLKVLQISSCHVYLTYPFVLGWSCVEALSSGCVVVGSRTPPVQEVIEDGVTGHLVDFFDTAALADRVCEVLADRHGWAAMRERARARVIERYDLQTRCLPEQLAFMLEGL
jgi:glycosyltransferase involved in cell wall biosynthesis